MQSADVKSNPTRSVERIRRSSLRRPTSNERPVIDKLYDFTEKDDNLRSSYKLGGTNIPGGVDFSLKVHNARANLWKSCLDEKGESAKASL